MRQASRIFASFHPLERYMALGHCVRAWSALLKVVRARGAIRMFELIFISHIEACYLTGIVDFNDLRYFSLVTEHIYLENSALLFLRREMLY